jgi:hypothetical protein
MSLIGKRIECHLDTAHGDRKPFVADVKRGRHESEVYLVPVEPENKPEGYSLPPRGYYDVGIVYCRQILREDVDGAAPGSLAVLADAGLATPPPEELTDGRRLSESPISSDTRRKRGRGGALDHGTAAAQPDEFAEK